MVDINGVEVKVQDRNSKGWTKMVAMGTMDDGWIWLNLGRNDL